MAGTTGLEPATSAVTGQRSNQLSYVPKCISLLGYVVHRTEPYNASVVAPTRSSLSELHVRQDVGDFFYGYHLRRGDNNHREVSDIFAGQGTSSVCLDTGRRGSPFLCAGEVAKLFISLRLGGRTFVIDLLHCGRQAVFVYAVDKRPSADIEVSSRLRLVTAKPFQRTTN